MANYTAAEGLLAEAVEVSLAQDRRKLPARLVRAWTAIEERKETTFPPTVERQLKGVERRIQDSSKKRRRKVRKWVSSLSDRECEKEAARLVNWLHVTRSGKGNAARARSRGTARAPSPASSNRSATARPARS
jgi:hypothetical protein